MKKFLRNHLVIPELKLVRKRNLLNPLKKLEPEPSRACLDHVKNVEKEKPLVREEHLTKGGQKYKNFNIFKIYEKSVMFLSL